MFGYALIVAVMVTLGGIELVKAQEQPINLTVTNAEIQLIGEGLGSLPYGKVAALMNKLQLQINSQAKPPEAKAPEAPKVEAPKAE